MSEDTRAYLHPSELQSLVARMDAADRQRERAITIEAESSEKRVLEAERLFDEKITALERQVDRRLHAAAELTKQHQKLHALADEKEERERDKAAHILREGLSENMKSGDRELLQHIEHQKEQVAAAFAASEKAIDKAETSIKERLAQMDNLREQINTQAGTFITRDLYDQFVKENRRLAEATAESVNVVGTRVTEIEARGGGEQDHSANLKSILSLGLSAVSAIIAFAAVAMAFAQ